MVNIRDIARRAGVSVATVSHVINRSRFVSDKLVYKVEKAMGDLDYQPNLLAGSLRKKKTGTVGLVIPDSSNMLFADISKALEDIFFVKKYNIIVCNSAYDIEREVEHLKTLRSKMVDGIIIIPASTDGEYILSIRSAGIPIVLMDRKIPGMDLDYVLNDNDQGGYLAGKHIIELGHKNIGYIDRSTPHYHSTERKMGFERALSEAGLNLGGNIVRGGFTFNDGSNAAREMMAKRKNITAIFSFNDINAMGAIRALKDIGFSIPEDISVMGFDDIALSPVFIPGLTTIHYPVKEMVKEASSILLERIKNPLSMGTREIIVKPEIIVRESTAAAR